ncbi:MAG: type III secretion system chaperone [Pseudomonadota bacterium]
METNGMNFLLNDFGKSIGINELAFNENGYCCLMFDQVVVNIELIENSERFFLYTHLGEIPLEKREEFYSLLLEADFFNKETADGTLGIDRESNIVALTYQRPYTGLDQEKFEKILENYVNAAEHWTKKIQEFPASFETIFTMEAFPEGGLVV